MAGYIGSKSSVVLNAGATSAQGALADTAVQPNDNVTLGAVTATSFAGDGSALTNLPSSAPAAGITQHPVGSYLLLSRQVSGASLPLWFYTTVNASSSPFTAYQISGPSYVAVSINYGVWMCMGLTYGSYDVLVVRIA